MIRYAMFFALAIGIGFAVWDMGQRGARAYERMLSERVMNGLDVLGYSWAEVHADGLRLELHGHAPDKFERELAFESAKATATIARISNFATATLAPPENRDPVRVELHRDKRGITMTGQTAGRTMRDALNQALARSGPELVVHDLTGIQAAFPRRRINPEIKVASLAATRLPNAYVVMEPGAVTVEGQSLDEADRENLSQELLEAAGDKVTLTLKLRVPAKVIAPFAFSAEKEIGGSIRLERCAVRTREERATLLTRLNRARVGDRADPCQVGLGGPRADWTQAILAGLDGLTSLPAGRIDVEYRHARLIAFPPTSPTEFEKIVAAFQSALPDGFEGSTELRGDDVATRTGIAREQYWLQMSRGPEGLALAGQVPNDAVEAAITAYAAALFGGSNVASSLFQIEADPPGGWQVAALRLLDHLGHAVDGEAEMAGYMVHLRATLQDAEIARDVHQDLTDLLPGYQVSTTLTVDLPSIFTLIPLPGVRCAEQLNRVYHGAPVDFRTGSARISDGSDQVLGDLADVMGRCTANQIEVGGHTDSQGTDEVNQRISQARAEAVMQALVAKGVPTSRLAAKGYGETIPIADNSTDEGRARNRRIEFRAVD